MSDLLLGYPNTQENISSGQERYIIDNRGDLQFDNRGQLVLAENEEKLRQNVGKILLTLQGKSIVAPEYGSSLQSFIGTSMASPDTTYALMKQTIIDALGYLVKQYEDSTNPKEKLSTLETLAIKLEEILGGQVNVDLAVTNEESQSISIRIIL